MRWFCHQHWPHQPVASTLRSLVDAKAELETTSAMPRCLVGKALYEASSQGHWEIVQLLAEAKDADVCS